MIVEINKDSEETNLLVVVHYQQNSFKLFLIIYLL